MAPWTRRDDATERILFLSTRAPSNKVVASTMRNKPTTSTRSNGRRASPSTRPPCDRLKTAPAATSPSTSSTPPSALLLTAVSNGRCGVRDGAVGVVFARASPLIASETVWCCRAPGQWPASLRQQLYRMGANSWPASADEDELLSNPCVVTLPAGQDDQLKGSSDLIEMILITRDVTDKTTAVLPVLAGEYLDEAKMRRQMLDTLSSPPTDDRAHSRAESRSIHRKALRRGHGSRTSSSPVHCGSSKMFHGVQHLLDLVVDWATEARSTGRLSTSSIRRQEPTGSGARCVGSDECAAFKTVPTRGDLSTSGLLRQ